MKGAAGIKRRTLLEAGAMAGVGSFLFPRSARGANARINLAFVGAGGKGWHAIQCLQGNPDVNMAAFADVDLSSAQQARVAHPTVPFYVDFREMLDTHGRGIDGVVVSTPDHTHHYIAKWCMLAGKHVYLEKPLAHNIAEVRDLVALERGTGLACQMGNQGHSGSGTAMLDEWIKAGVLGEIREVHAWCNPNWAVADRRPEPRPVPATLDWDKWLGPAAEVPYSPEYCPVHWRSWYDFGCGSMGDWFCHNADAPYFALGLDCPRRIEIESTGSKILSFPDSARIRFVFPSAGERREIQLNWYQGCVFTPPRPEGLEPDCAMGSEGGGTLLVGSRATAMTGSHAGPPRIIPHARHREMAPTLPRTGTNRSDHWSNWLNAIRGAERVRSSFAYGGRLTETMMWGNIALHAGRNLEIDPRRRCIVGDKEAARLMAWPEPRRGWKQVPVKEY